MVTKSFTFNANKTRKRDKQYLSSFQNEFVKMVQVQQSTNMIQPFTFTKSLDRKTSLTTYTITMEKMQTDYFEYSNKCIENNTIPSMQTVKKLAKNMFNGLNDMHKQGLGHFDIKPENLFLNLDKNNEFEIDICKIGDLGNAKQFYDFDKNVKIPVLSRRFKSYTPEYCGMFNYNFFSVCFACILDTFFFFGLQCITCYNFEIKRLHTYHNNTYTHIIYIYSS